MSEDKELDEMMKRMRAHLRTSSSHGNIHGVDPDNPFAIRQHEKEASNFYKERSELKANILYVHGLASSGNSGTARTIQKYLPNSKVFSPDLPVNPHEALALLNNIVANEKIDVVVGTSMGGMFAQKMRGIPKVVVNPSFHVSESMRRKIGIMPFFKKREDGSTEFEITPELCDEYRSLENGQFDNLSPREIDITFGLFGTDDDVVSCEKEYDAHYINKMIFPGGHRLSDENIHDYVIEAILKLMAHR